MCREKERGRRKSRDCCVLNVSKSVKIQPVSCICFSAAASARDFRNGEGLSREPYLYTCGAGIIVIPVYTYTYIHVLIYIYIYFYTFTSNGAGLSQGPQTELHLQSHETILANSCLLFKQRMHILICIFIKKIYSGGEIFLGIDVAIVLIHVHIYTYIPQHFKELCFIFR